MSSVLGDMSFHSVPVWLVALVLAIASPLLVRLYGDHLERQTAARTRRFVERLAKATATEPGDAADEMDSAEVDEVKGAPRDG